MPRIVDLDDAVNAASETLSQVALHPVSFVESCGDLLPEEVCRYAADLMQLARLASTLAELAVDSLAEDRGHED